MKIKNVIFDVGNVLVKWAPLELLEAELPEFDAVDTFEKMKPTWIELNLGKFSESEVIEIYANELNIPISRSHKLMQAIKQDQTPIDGSIALLEFLYEYPVNLYAITDNVKELITYHKENSEFPKYFIDIIVSADLGILKPDPEIYKHLLNKHSLDATESIFIDDISANVEGAISLGMRGLQFVDTDSCKEHLLSLL